MELGFKHCASSLHFFQGHYDLSIASSFYKWGNRLRDGALFKDSHITWNVDSNSDLPDSSVLSTKYWLGFVQRRRFCLFGWFGFGFLGGERGVEPLPSSCLTLLELHFHSKLSPPCPLACVFFTLFLRAPSKYLIKMSGLGLSETLAY